MKNWGTFLNLHFCLADESTGNRPCDSGKMCDDCRTYNATELYKKYIGDLGLTDNSKAWADVIKRYEEITLSEINSNSYPLAKCEVDWMRYGRNTKQFHLAGGFGIRNQERLCTDINGSCSKCNWIKFTGMSCMEGKNAPTYKAIQQPVTDELLLQGFKQRAAYMKKVETIHNNTV